MSAVPRLYAPPMSREEINNLAWKIRAILDLTEKPYFDILPFVEHILPKLVDDLIFYTVPIEEMPEAHGQYRPETRELIIRDDVYNGAVHGVGRDRMTVAHESSHALLHRDIGLNLNQLDPQKNIRTFEDPEWQAKAFAGALLAPPQMIIGKNYTALNIATLFGISLEAAEFNLTKIPPSPGT